MIESSTVRVACRRDRRRKSQALFYGLSSSGCVSLMGCYVIKPRSCQLRYNSGRHKLSLKVLWPSFMCANPYTKHSLYAPNFEQPNTIRLLSASTIQITLSVPPTPVVTHRVDPAISKDSSCWALAGSNGKVWSRSTFERKYGAHLTDTIRCIIILAT